MCCYIRYEGYEFYDKKLLIIFAYRILKLIEPQQSQYLNMRIPTYLSEEACFHRPF